MQKLCLEIKNYIMLSMLKIWIRDKIELRSDDYKYERITNCIMLLSLLKYFIFHLL